MSKMKEIKIERFALILIGSKEMQQKSQNDKVMVPLYNIPQMSDEEWNHLAEQNRKERLVQHG